MSEKSVTVTDALGAGPSFVRAVVPRVALAPVNEKEFPHYFKRVPSGVTHVDVYWVLEAFGVASQPVGHAIKKLLCAGQRGAKGREKDLLEAIASLKRALELENQGP